MQYLASAAPHISTQQSTLLSKIPHISFTLFLCFWYSHCSKCFHWITDSFWLHSSKDISAFCMDGPPRLTGHYKSTVYLSEWNINITHVQVQINGIIWHWLFILWGFFVCGFFWLVQCDHCVYLCMKLWIWAMNLFIVLIDCLNCLLFSFPCQVLPSQRKSQWTGEDPSGCKLITDNIGQSLWFYGLFSSCIIWGILIDEENKRGGEKGSSQRSALKGWDRADCHSEQHWDCFRYYIGDTSERGMWAFPST